MLNKEKATTLFNQNACLVNNEDVVPENTAVEITSADAVGFAKQSPGVTHNSCGIGDYEMKYLTKKGFFLAITYQNVDEHRQNQAIIRSRIRPVSYTHLSPFSLTDSGMTSCRAISTLPET